MAMANLAVRNGCDTMIWIRDVIMHENQSNAYQQALFT